MGLILGLGIPLTYILIAVSGAIHEYRSELDRHVRTCTDEWRFGVHNSHEFCRGRRARWGWWAVWPLWFVVWPTLYILQRPLPVEREQEAAKQLKRSERKLQDIYNEYPELRPKENVR